MTPPMDEIWMMWPEPCAHDRQCGLGHPQRAKQIGLDLGAGLFFADFLNRAELAIACIVDDNVQPAEALVGRCHGSINRLLVIDVELDGGNLVAIFFDEVRQGVGVSCGRGHAVATGEGCLRPDPPKTLRCPGDEPNFLRHDPQSFAVRAMEFA